MMSPFSSLPSFLSVTHLGAETGTNTSARDLYHHYVSTLAFSEKRSKKLKRRSVVDSDVFHVHRDVVFVWKRVRRPIHRRVLFN